MTLIRIIGPGRAGRPWPRRCRRAAAMFAGFLRAPRRRVRRRRAGVDVLVIATPDDAIAEVAAAVVPVAATTRAPPLGLARASTCWRRIPRRASLHPLVPLPTREVGAARLRLGGHLRRGRRPGGARDRRVPRRRRGRGERRRPGGLPRRRLHRGQPRGGAAGPGRAGGRVGRARSRRLPAAGPGRGRRRGRARARAGPDRSGRAGGTGPPSSRHLDALDPRRARRLPGRCGAGPPAGARTPPRAGHRRRAADPACRPTPGRAGGRSYGAAGDDGRRSRPPRGCRDALDRARAAGRTRRAGADHGGAARRAPLPDRRGPRAECDVVAVSIFVNPLQFGDPEDIGALPDGRSSATWSCAPQAGASTSCSSRRCDEMYPSWPRRRRRRCRSRGVSDALGGRVAPGPLRRCGHGGGEAVLHRRRLPGLLRREGLPAAGGGPAHGVRPLACPVEVVGCPTVREADGLALSSRNVRLSGRRARGGDRAVAGPGRRPGRPGRRCALGRGGGGGHAGRRRRRATGARSTTPWWSDAATLEEARILDDRVGLSGCSWRPRWAPSG